MLSALGTEPERPAGPRRSFLLWGLVVLALVSVYTFFSAPLFRVTEIRVSGNQVIPAQPIMAATGVRRGDLRWSHPVASVEERLLAAGLGLVAAEAQWRSGGVLVVTVTERETVALLPYYNAFAVLDAEGYIMSLGDLTKWRLPLITGVSLRRALLGQQVKDPGLTGALYVAQLLPAHLKADLSEIAVGTAGDLSLVFNGPVMVQLGPPADLRDKLLALVPVYAEAQAQGKHINLANPKYPTLVPRQPLPMPVL